MNELKVSKTCSQAILPIRSTDGSAGFDLFACLDETVVLQPKETKLIPTGIRLGIESKQYAAFLYARSGLASKFGIIPANCVGVIDSDYRGEIMIPLMNLKEQAFQISHGDRVAQMVIAPVVIPQLIETEELSCTARGEDGFGSTGR